MRRARTSDRVRQRLRDEKDVRKVGQRELADLATKHDDERWTQSRVGKVLTGAVKLTVDDADVLARALGISLVEAARDRGLEFYAELTPTEVRILDQLRRRPVEVLHAVGTLLGVSVDLPKPQPITSKSNAKRKVGRPLKGKPESGASA